jgi:hypothetical protein
VVPLYCSTLRYIRYRKCAHACTVYGFTLTRAKKCLHYPQYYVLDLESSWGDSLYSVRFFVSVLLYICCTSPSITLAPKRFKTNFGERGISASPDHSFGIGCRRVSGGQKPLMPSSAFWRHGFSRLLHSLISPSKIWCNVHNVISAVRNGKFLKSWPDWVTSVNPALPVPHLHLKCIIFASLSKICDPSHRTWY